MGWRIFLVYAPKFYEYSFILAVKTARDLRLKIETLYVYLERMADGRYVFKKCV